MLKADLDEVKRLSLCTSQNNCYVIHTEFLVRDVSDNHILGCS